MSGLVVDVGNSSTAMALASDLRVSRVAHVSGGIARIDDVSAALAKTIKNRSVEGVVLASVVPAVTPKWCRLLRKMTGYAPLVVKHTVRLGVAVKYPDPKTIGADRLANACGAFALFGAPLIVADFGTALTFDIVSPDGAYVGGVIAPGLPLMTDYLAEKTALLPHIHLPGRSAGIGRSTRGAMRIGARVGYRGMVREIVNHIKVELGSNDVALCATGGFAGWALQGLDMPFAIKPNLTLSGLGRVFELNKESE